MEKILNPEKEKVLGRRVNHWQSVPLPENITIKGQYCEVKPLNIKADAKALYQASRRAAERLGFTFEGVTRQTHVFKGRNRDTMWYSILDSEWPALKERFERWLDTANFDALGRQIKKLSEC